MGKMLDKTALIDSKQLYAIIFFLMISMKMFMAPSLLIHDAGRDSYITMAVFIAVETVMLLAALLAVKLADCDLYTLLESVYGKPLTTVFLLVLSAHHILKITLIISEVKVFFTFSASEEFNWTIYVIPIFLFLFTVSVKTLNGIGRLAQIILPVVLVSIVLLFVLIVGHIDYSNIFPVLENGPSGVIEGLKKYPVWFGDLPMIAFCCGKVKKSKGFVIKSMLTAGAGIAVVLYFASVLFLTYAYLYPMVDYGHNISNMVVYAAGNYMYGRFDLLIFCVWLNSVFIQMAYMAYVTVRHVAHVFRAQNNNLPTLGVLGIIYVMSVFIFRSEIKLYHFCMGIPRYFTLVNSVLIPVLVLIAALLYRRKRQKEGENDDASQKNIAV